MEDAKQHGFRGFRGSISEIDHSGTKNTQAVSD